MSLQRWRFSLPVALQILSRVPLAGDGVGGAQRPVGADCRMRGAPQGRPAAAVARLDEVDGPEIGVNLFAWHFPYNRSVMPDDKQLLQDRQLFETSFARARDAALRAGREPVYRELLEAAQIEFKKERSRLDKRRGELLQSAKL